MNMKKIVAVASVAALLGGCAYDSDSAFGGGTGIGGSVVKMAVDHQCRSELNKRNEWRLVALTMSAEKQREWEDKICGCASEEALNQVSAQELMDVLNPSSRDRAIASVTVKTVNACFKRLYR
ncbi:lipoprotein [Neisseria flavescens]|nr:lipoprotein [Neisseria flavescens]